MTTAATTTATTVPRRAPARTLGDIAVITRRSLRHTLRVPVGLVLSAVMPVIFIVMFNAVFGGAVQGVLPPAAGGKYINWLLPGLLAQFALFMGAGTASGLAEDLGKGTIDRFRSLPMARSAVVAGRTVSDLVEASVILTLMVLVGAALGFRWQTSLAGMAAGLAVALVFGYAMSWVMATVGLLVRTAEAVQAAVYMVVFPLAFTSSVFVPAQTMPGWLEPFAANQPITVVSDALRGLVLGQGALAPGETVAGQVGLSLVWAVAIVAVFAPLAVRAYRRTLR
jgi:ABC transporter DrrB family efflux protein